MESRKGGKEERRKRGKEEREKGEKGGVVWRFEGEGGWYLGGRAGLGG